MPATEIRSNIEDLIRDARMVNEREIPFALARALTWTAKNVREAEQAEMRRVFDRPTRYTMNYFAIVPATKRSLVASIEPKAYLKRHRFLEVQVTGGRRPAKRLETRLREVGAIGTGDFVVPGKDARLDRYGNMSTGQVSQIMSEIRASTDPNQNVTARSKKRSRRRRGRIFVLRRGAQAFAIAERRGRTLKILLAVTRAPHYRMRFDFFGVAKRTADNRIAPNFDRSFDMVIKAGAPSRRAA